MLAGILILALLAKYTGTLFAFDVPLGYDAGIYRYLFVKYAGAWPPFMLPDLEPWAREHPLGLFVLTSVLMKLGLPVDWLIGWMWNCVPVVLACVLAWVAWREQGKAVGILTLLVALLSVAQFHAFQAMYWKTEMALLWFVLTLFFLERSPLRAGLFGVATLATHHQTGLLLGLVLLTHGIILVVREGWNPRIRRFTFLGIAIALFGSALYAPVWQDAVMPHLARILARGADVPPGSFPGVRFALTSSGILFALGAVGFVWRFRTERFSPWHLAVVWSLLFVSLQLFFHRRFLLHLDFFLLPFAAAGLAALWSAWKTRLAHGLLIASIAVQAISSVSAIAPRLLPEVLRVRMVDALPEIRPSLDGAIFAAIQRLPATLPEGAFVLALEPESAPWLRGWLPHERVAGPGVFSSPWDYAGWERFLLGSALDRRELLWSLPRPLFLFVSPAFRVYYSERADRFLADPCFEKTPHPMLLKVVCPSALPPFLPSLPSS